MNNKKNFLKKLLTCPVKKIPTTRGSENKSCGNNRI